jgi:hypothetical protein
MVRKLGDVLKLLKRERGQRERSEKGQNQKKALYHVTSKGNATQHIFTAGIQAEGSWRVLSISLL